ncbi:MAG: hypothetical protein JRJ85_20860, partial [Deltaproteobacteria bacterium]|nr:hypothetical protein [Deltaproteobacteria bacterium]
MPGRIEKAGMDPSHCSAGASDARDFRSKLVIKAVRNVRRGYEDDESDRGM